MREFRKRKVQKEHKYPKLCPKDPRAWNGMKWEVTTETRAQPKSTVCPQDEHREQGCRDGNEKS
jgi:hypothetical protein